MMRKLRRMELTELFSGFKNKRLRKTVPSRVISGCHRLSMSEIGETTVKKGSAFSTIKTETNMKGCGQLTNDMARELTGETKARNSAVNILATGLKTRSMVAVRFSTRMVIAMTDTG